MRTQIVLIDLENVQPVLLPLLQAEHIQVRIFIGPAQHKLSADMVLAAQELGGRAQFVRVNKPGKEALDLHLAYYVGCLTHEFRGAFFHIISKDQGFASLVEHLNQQGANARLEPDLRHFQASSMAAEMPADLSARVAIAAQWLKVRPTSRPARRKTLLSSLEKSTFANRLDSASVAAVFDQLLANQWVQLQGEKVVYAKALHD